MPRASCPADYRTAADDILAGLISTGRVMIRAGRECSDELFFIGEFGFLSKDLGFMRLVLFLTNGCTHFNKNGISALKTGREGETLHIRITYSPVVREDPICGRCSIKPFSPVTANLFSRLRCKLSPLFS